MGDVRVAAHAIWNRDRLSIINEILRLIRKDNRFVLLQIDDDNKFSTTIDLPARLVESGGTLLINLLNKSALDDILSHPDVALAIASDASSASTASDSHAASPSEFMRIRGGIINYGGVAARDLASSAPDPLRYLVIQESTKPGCAGRVGSIGVVRFENAAVVEEIVVKICDDHDASVTYEYLHSVASSLVANADEDVGSRFGGQSVAEVIFRVGGAVTALQQAGVSTIFLGNEPPSAVQDFCAKVDTIKTASNFRASLKVAIWLIDPQSDDLYSHISAHAGAEPRPTLRGNFGILLLCDISIARRGFANSFSHIRGVETHKSN